MTSSPDIRAAVRRCPPLTDCWTRRAFVLHPRVPVCVCLCVWQYTVDVDADSWSSVPSLPQKLINPTPTYEDKGKALSLLSPLLIVDVRPGVEKEGTRWGVWDGGAIFSHWATRQRKWVDFMIWDAFVHPRVLMCEYQKRQESFLAKRHFRSFQVIRNFFGNLNLPSGRPLEIEICQAESS